MPRNDSLGPLLKLDQFDGHRWIPVGEIQSTIGGRWEITKLLEPGRYRIRTDDRRYSGQLVVELENSPLADLIIEATPVP